MRYTNPIHPAEARDGETFGRLREAALFLSLFRGGKTARREMGEQISAALALGWPWTDIASASMCTERTARNHLAAVEG